MLRVSGLVVPQMQASSPTSRVGQVESGFLQAQRSSRYRHMDCRCTSCPITAGTPLPANLYLSSRILHGQILSRTTSRFTFPFDNSVQGALLNVLLRCRHLPIRRDAAQLLQLCPDKGEIWQPAALVALCNWKIDLEERGRPQAALETGLLLENARVYVEGAREFVKDGQRVVEIRFQRGAWNGSSEIGSLEEQAPNVSIGLAELLGMRMALLLHPASESKVCNRTTDCQP